MTNQYRWRLKRFKAEDIFLTGCGLEILLLPSPNPYMDIFKGKKNYRSTYSEEEFDALAKYYGFDREDFEKVIVSDDLEDIERDMWSRTEFVPVNGKTVMICRVNGKTSLQRRERNEDTGSEEPSSTGNRRE